MEDRRVNITHGGIPGAAVELPSWVLRGLGGAHFAGGVARPKHHGDVRKLWLGGAAAGGGEMPLGLPRGQFWAQWPLTGSIGRG